MYGVHFRDELDEPVAREFDALISKFKAFLLREHNEDGTHNFSPDSLNNDTIQQIIDGYQKQGQWWKTGPWLLNDPTGATPPNVAILRPPDPAAGTYHNYAPPGIDTAVGMSIEPLGDITITGIKSYDVRNDQDRLFFLRNRDSGASITLTHEDTGSVAAYRFDLPNDEDVVLGPRQNAWLYYDPDRERWTLTITGMSAGGLGAGDTSSGGAGGGSGAVKMVSRTLSLAEMQTIDTVPLDLIPAGGAGTVILPVAWSVITRTTTASGGPAPSYRLRWAGTVLDALANLNSGANSIQNLWMESQSELTTAQALTSVDNLAVQISSSLDIGGTFVGTADVKVWYVDGSILGTSGTNALLDATSHTDTVAQAVTRGSLVYGNATPKWDELPIGAADFILQSDGTDISWVDPSTVVTGGVVVTATVALSEVAIEAGNSGIELVAAEAGKVIMPMHCVVEIDLTVAYTSSPTWSLRWNGIAQNISGGVTPVLTSSLVKRWFRLAPTDGALLPTGGDPTGAALHMFLNANPGTPGTGVVTGTARIAYLLLDGF